MEKDKLNKLSKIPGQDSYKHWRPVLKTYVTHEQNTVSSPKLSQLQLFCSSFLAHKRVRGAGLC